jgi:hypothetical protein
MESREKDNDGNGFRSHEATGFTGDQPRGDAVRSPRRLAGVRASAVRQAREAKAARDVRLREREVAVEQVLAEYYAATGQAGEIWRRARERTERIRAEAETATRGLMADADEALRRLRSLGESREAIRELTQLSASRLRLALTDPASDAETSEVDRPSSGVADDGTRVDGRQTFLSNGGSVRLGRHAEPMETVPLWEATGGRSS